MPRLIPYILLAYGVASLCHALGLSPIVEAVEPIRAIIVTGGLS